MDPSRGPSHLRYALRTIYWMGASIVCLAFGHWIVEDRAGVNLAAMSWSRLAVVFVPLAYTCWVGRRPEVDASWEGTVRSCAIGVGAGLVFDLYMAISSPSPGPATMSAVLSAALVAAALPLPRLTLSALTPGIFGEEASIEGFRDQRGRQVLGSLFAGSAVAAVLFAIVMPNFLVFGLRAKAGEMRVEIEAIREAQAAWYAEHGEYLPTTAFPPEPPGMHRAEFDSDAHAASGFERLGWPRDQRKAFYCRYAVTVENGVGAADGYTIEAICDLDGDGDYMAFGWLKPAPGARVGVPGPFGYCTVRGVLPIRGARGDERVLEKFGPCNTASSVSRF